MLNLMWFRSDLRTYDNPALTAAMSSGVTIAIYCLTEQQWDKHHISVAKRALVTSQLKSLEQQLAKLRVPFIVLNCGTFANCPDRIVEFCQQHSINQIFCNLEYELNEQNCLKAVFSRTQQHGVNLFAYHDQCAIAPGEILNQSGQMYKVFSAFKRAYFSAFNFHARPLHNLPEPQGDLPTSSDLSALDSIEVDTTALDDWPAGEDEAHQRLNLFLESQVYSYHEDRDYPALDATSGLSAYLAVGIISTRQCLQAALSLNEGMLGEGNQGVVSWINELIWRDFYRHLINAEPRLCKHQAFQQETERLPWSKNQSDFQRWCEGRTGIPIIDAAMRQLNQTGWMHNLLRMVCAMFLTKDLFIDWRWGEQFFMEKLIDGDFASNNGGWQWSASTGVDAAPYFRIFNPYRQSERFDPKGSFIRKYVPELAEISGKAIHCPPEKILQVIQYPSVMVDHKTATAEVKNRFKQLKPESA